MFNASAWFIAIGFSHKTCFPACRACMLCGPCRNTGVAIRRHQTSRGATLLPGWKTRGLGFAHEQPALFDDAYLYPLPYQPEHASITDSLLDHFHELLSHDRVKVCGNVQLQNPFRGSSANDSPHFVQRL